MRLKQYLIFIYFICSVSFCFGQTEIDTSGIFSDSIYEANKESRFGLFSVFKGKPGKAALAGLLFPSAGQFYNKRYWKVPIVLAAEGTILFFAIDRTRYWNELNGAYLGLLNETITDYQGVTDPNLIKPTRDFIRKQKDYLWIGFGIIHVLAITEAFVDAHLLDFDIDDDLSIKLAPNASPAGISFLHVSIPLSKKKPLIQKYIL